MARLPGRAGPIRIASAIAGLSVAAFLGWYTLSSNDLKVLFSSWAVPAATALYLVQQAGCGLAWHSLLVPPRPSRREFFVIRWIRTSIAGLLPVGGFGAALVAVRLAMLAGLRMDTAGASLTLDATVEMVTQVAFTITGLILLFASATEPQILEWSAVGLLLVVFTVVVFIGAQRAGGMKLVEAGLSCFADRWPRLSLVAEARLHDELMHLHARHRQILMAGLIHFISWLLTAAETWVVLFTVCHPISPAKCIVLECLATAARSIGFFIPGALGVQEIALLGGGALVGLAPETAVLIAVVKRLRDIVVGVAGLALWQQIEGDRLLGSTTRAAPLSGSRRGFHLVNPHLHQTLHSSLSLEMRHDSTPASVSAVLPKRPVPAEYCSDKTSMAAILDRSNMGPEVLQSGVKSRQRYDAMLPLIGHSPMRSGLRLAFDRVLGTFVVILWIVQTLLRR